MAGIDDGNLEKLISDADAEMGGGEVSPKNPASDDKDKPDGQTGPKETITGEPDITPADAKEISEFVIHGTFGLVEDVWPVVAYPPEVTQKGIDRLTPLMQKHAAKAFPLAGRKMSVLKIYKAYSDEIKAAWFFSNLIVQTVRGIRAGNEDAPDGQQEESGKTE